MTTDNYYCCNCFSNKEVLCFVYLAADVAGADPEFYEKTGLFAYVPAAAKLAHAHYRQASRARSARSWPVPNPQQVVDIYVAT